jgi:hypothetical protein
MKTPVCIYRVTMKVMYEMVVYNEINKKKLDFYG